MLLIFPEYLQFAAYSLGMYPRIIGDHVANGMKSKFGILLLGPRQTGKSTLLNGIVNNHPARTKLIYRFNELDTHRSIVSDPSRIKRSVLGSLPDGDVLLFIDEVQYIPEVLNDCQTILDRYSDKVTVLLTGSSARKIKSRGANLLPGRLLHYNLHPLTCAELGISEAAESRILPDVLPLDHETQFGGNLEDILTYGTLPGVCDLPGDLRREILGAYTTTYLQEEIRMEALARKLGGFSRVLEHAAIESGNVMNYSSMSQDIGVPVSTMRNYFDLLLDTLILIRIPAYTRNARRRLIKSPKLLFFDTGVRNAAASLELNPERLLKSQAGTLFEQFVTLEIYRRIQYTPGCSWRLAYWRTTSGAEVDLVVDKGDSVIPIEVKYTENPRPADARHLKTFMNEYDAPEGYLVCRCRNVERLAENIYAVPWRVI